MLRFFKLAIVLPFIALIAFSSCQKKVTKVEPMPEPERAQPAIVEQVKPVEPPPVDVFIPQDIDAKLREILQTVYFDFDSYELRPDAISILGRVGSLLSENRNIRILIEGHCDERGSSEYNMGLGEKRAKAVKKYLTSYGISEDRVETTSYGKERLVKYNCSADDFCSQANRRAEWQVLAK